MTIFVDTSALYAVLDADDSNHTSAKATWARLLEHDEELITTSYVLVEAFALVQRRLGIDAVQVLHQDMAPVLKIEWVNAAQHALAMDRLLVAGNREISLVDWISFVTMRQWQLTVAFAFDSDFASQGFECLA